MSDEKFTKFVTDVYFAAPEPGHEPVFERREVPIVRHFDQKPFYAREYPTKEETQASLLSMYQEVRLEKYKRLGKQPPELFEPVVRDENRRLSRYKEKVNRKRRHIEACLRGQTSPNFAVVARLTGCHRSTVRGVYHDLLRQGHASVYEYNNLKSAEDDARLGEAIEGIEKTFNTVSDLRRKLPGFSKKYVLWGLKSRGYRFRKVPKVKIPKVRDPFCVVRTIQHITLAHEALDDPSTMLYADEMKFPLFQSSYRHWMHPDLPDPTLRNVREAWGPKTMITAMVLCSRDKFLAVSFCDDVEINAQCFVYFLVNAVQRLPADKKYSILVDNATWHRCKFVDKTEVSNFIFFNMAKMFQLSMIENMFSHIRANFRKRPFLENLQDEVAYIVRLFFDPDNDRKFRAIYRNHLRVLMKYLNRYDLPRPITP